MAPTGGVQIDRAGGGAIPEECFVCARGAGQTPAHLLDAVGPVGVGATESYRIQVHKALGRAAPEQRVAELSRLLRSEPHLPPTSRGKRTTHFPTRGCQVYKRILRRRKGRRAEAERERWHQ